MPPMGPTKPPRTPPTLVEVWRRVTLARGVELQVEPGRAGLNQRQMRELVKRTRAVLEDLSREKDE